MPVLDAVDGRRGYGRRITDTVPRFVVQFSQALNSMKGNQKEVAVGRIVSISRWAALHAMVFKSYKNWQQTVTHFANK